MRKPHGSNRSQLGFALVAALFLIVVLAALGLFAVKIASTQEQSIDLELLGARAQAAANSGIEYAANRAAKHGNCSNVNPPLNFTQGVLQGFSAQFTCILTTHTNSTGSHQVYELTATATYGTYGTTNYVSRSLKRTVMN